MVPPAGGGDAGNGLAPVTRLGAREQRGIALPRGCELIAGSEFAFDAPYSVAKL